MATELVRYDAARKALAEAWKVDDVKTIRDKAMAMQVYAKQAQDRELIDQATDIRLRAEIRAGELLAEMKVRGERQKPGDVGTPKSRKRKDGSSALPSTAPRLSDLGVTKTQSSRWQKLAALPRAQQDALIARAKSKAEQAIERTAVKRKSNGKVIDIDDDAISRAAIQCALAVRELVLAQAEKMKPDDIEGLLIALRDEFRDLKSILNKRKHAKG
jgi:hypothetical protein